MSGGNVKNKNFYIALGRKLQKIRVASGLKRSAVLKEIGIASCTLHSYEEGNVRMPIDILYLLSKLYKLPLEDCLPNIKPSLLGKEVNDIEKSKEDKTFYSEFDKLSASIDEKVIMLQELQNDIKTIQKMKSENNERKEA